jgi:hypothetical protein
MGQGDLTMGLDVWMYKSDDCVAHREWENRRDAIPYGQGGAAYEEALEKFDAENPDPAPEEKVQHDSRVHPEHMFKVGYLRSSYNEGGIERVLATQTGKGLHYVFFGDVDDGYEYLVRPDWGACLKRAIEARDALALHVNEHGAFGISRVAPNSFCLPPKDVDSEEKAMAIFREKWKERKPDHPFGNSFSTGAGEFRLDEPMQVVAMIHGIDSMLARLGAPPRECLFVVYKRDMTWYQQALEIVVEMIEWVIGQPDAQKHFLHWSG